MLQVCVFDLLYVFQLKLALFAHVIRCEVNWELLRYSAFIVVRPLWWPGSTRINRRAFFVSRPPLSSTPTTTIPRAQRLLKSTSHKQPSISHWRGRSIRPTQYWTCRGSISAKTNNMGCKGSWGYLYRGQYYIIYEGWSHPECLGKRLVSAVPSEPDAFKVWLAETKLFLEQVEETMDEDGSYRGVSNVLSRASYAPSITLDGAYFEFSYLYDLDHMVFVISERVFFPLDNLPHYEEWVAYLAVDGALDLCISPSTPDMFRRLVDERINSIKTLEAWEKEDLKLYEKVVPSMIEPSTLYGAPAPRWLSSVRNLAKEIFAGFISARYSAISTISMNFEELVFQDLAMELLTSAAPINSTFMADPEVAQSWVRKYELLNSFDEEWVRDRKFYGIDDPPERERCNAFWFRGRLIVLARTLVKEDHFKAKVGFVVRRTREKGLRECTALLWSVHHIAIVVVSGEKVSHSKVIPVVAAFGRENAEYERQFDKAVELLVHHLTPIAIDGGCFFRARLPLDIFIRIRDFADEETCAALGMTSKTLRLEHLKHPWIGPYVMTNASRDDDGFYARHEETGRRYKITIQPFPCLPYLDYDAIEDRQMNEKYVIYRLPFKFLDQSYSMYRSYGLDAPQFKKIHGYEVLVDKVTPEGGLVRLEPHSLLQSQKLASYLSSFSPYADFYLEQ
ncbi:hypothetical protein SCHPADRAFT_720078 [Schizopora paradoxa]|uniref:F-box domain-containing protein n=1 Tax=Schizopora paradoxa TaxID=27342 RepID=A0A0H2R7V7_9AGAM|nr:hypothetical protein SCHPADRAFT_720078 [Schizopora paradoxa]